MLIKIKDDPLLAEDKINDNNQIEFLLTTKFILKTMKLVIIIMNFSYFLGMFWVICCEIIQVTIEEYWAD